MQGCVEKRGVEVATFAGCPRADDPAGQREGGHEPGHHVDHREAEPGRGSVGLASDR